MQIGEEMVVQKFDDGGTAFPNLRRFLATSGGAGGHRDYEHVSVGGMSLRDYFAAQALAGWIAAATGPLSTAPPADIVAIVAEQTYRFADAMLKARAETTVALIDETELYLGNPSEGEVWGE